MQSTIQAPDTQSLLPSLRRFTLYTKALEFGRVVLAIQLHGSLRDQLHRAVESLILNIAEGAGQQSLLVKARHWNIARGSLWEVAAALDIVILRRGALADLPRLAGLVREIDAILAALLRKR